MNKLLINILSFSWETDLYINPEYINSFSDLYNREKIYTYIFYQGLKHNNQEKIKELSEKWIFIFNYIDELDLKNQIKKLSLDNNILYINTFNDSWIPLVENLRESIWQNITETKWIFRDKSLQRKKLAQYNPSITVKSLSYRLEDLNISEIEEKIDYPFVIKPLNGTESSGTLKINNKKEFEEKIKEYKNFLQSERKKVENNVVLLEEYIDWEMYSVAYFVNENQDFIFSRPVKVVSWNFLWIDDFFNFSRIISEKVEEECKKVDLKSFIQDTVIACGLKNTFVHHEFKINSKNEIKSIEINWRIWWYRLWMYNRWYNFNLFDFILWKKMTNKLESNETVILVYSEKRWILKWFNEELLEKVKKLVSLTSLKILDKNLKKEVWLTKDWFSKVIIIKLSNKDYSQFIKDYDFIKENYKDLLVVK